jgi:hypothetical protein
LAFFFTMRKFYFNRALWFCFHDSSMHHSIFKGGMPSSPSRSDVRTCAASALQVNLRRLRRTTAAKLRP